MNETQAYQLLKLNSSQQIQALSKGEREVLWATIALHQDKLDEAIEVLNSEQVEGIVLAVLVRAEAYRRKSVSAAKRAGSYAHAATANISKLDQAPLSLAMSEAEMRLQQFLRTGEGSKLDHILKQKKSKKLKQIEQIEQIEKIEKIEKITIPVAILRSIEAWRKDWQSLKHEAYMSHYDADFSAGKYNYTSWSRYKQRVNSRKQYVDVQLSDFQLSQAIATTAVGRVAVISFKQQYQSSNYAENSRKKMHLLRRPNSTEWKVLHEGDDKAVIKKELKRVKTKVVKHAAWVINVGSFSTQNNAINLVSRIKSHGQRNAMVARVFIHGAPLYRVRLGLYGEKDEARKVMRKFCPSQGFKNCWLEQPASAR
ncbi:MAG: SPOR domain-containing protein [Mariprofundaceae bacterium]